MRDPLAQLQDGRGQRLHRLEAVVGDAQERRQHENVAPVVLGRGRREAVAEAVELLRGSANTATPRSISASTIGPCGVSIATATWLGRRLASTANRPWLSGCSILGLAQQVWWCRMCPEGWLVGRSNHSAALVVQRGCEYELFHGGCGPPPRHAVDGLHIVCARPRCLQHRDDLAVSDCVQPIRARRPRGASRWERGLGSASRRLPVVGLIAARAAAVSRV
jgi:hypothetical protein